MCPADPLFVAFYLKSFINYQKQAGSMVNAFYGIRWGYHLVGIARTDNPLVKLRIEDLCLPNIAP